jgi:hypothetical protein
VLLHGGKKITSSVFSHIKQAKVEKFEISPKISRALSRRDIVDTNTGEVIVETNNELTQALIATSSMRAFLKCRLLPGA